LAGELESAKSLLDGLNGLDGSSSLIPSDDADGRLPS
jgi:hypothetical protein